MKMDCVPREVGTSHSQHEFQAFKQFHLNIKCLMGTIKE